MKLRKYWEFSHVHLSVIKSCSMHELAKRGHEVTIITIDAAFPKGEVPANLTEIDVGKVSYLMWKEELVVKPMGKNGNLQNDFNIIYKLITNIFDVQLKDKQMQKLIHDKNQTFDLVFSEAMVRPALVFSHTYKAPVIMMSSFGVFSDNYEMMGASMHPFCTIAALVEGYNYNLTLWEKVVELYDYLSIEWIHRNNYDLENQKIIRSHVGPDTPAVQELNNNVPWFFLNLHPVFEGNTSVPPSVIHMGGIHHKPRKDLPHDLQSYLDSSKNGVIYISFGTNVEPALFRPEKIATFVRVFSKLPYDVLWKWNNDELPGRTKNIKISKWLPQSDLLRCQINIRFFQKRRDIHKFRNKCGPYSTFCRKIRILVNVLSQLPYVVLWKWDSKKLPGRTENITTLKWWPQSDLLKHPNVKLFITQGGL